MKSILKLAFVSLSTALLSAYDNEKVPVNPMDVTPNNISGTWYLAEWNGQPLAEGSFAIDTDDELGAVIRGSYDYGAGDWTHRYIVTDLTKDSMVWTAKDDRSDISVYKRCNGIWQQALFVFRPASGYRSGVSLTNFTP